MATWGNLANRLLSSAYKRFDGGVPEPGDLDVEDQALLEGVEAGFETVGQLYNACKFRAALGEALALAREANSDKCARSMRAHEPAVAKQLPS